MDPGWPGTPPRRSSGPRHLLHKSHQTVFLYPAVQVSPYCRYIPVRNLAGALTLPDTRHSLSRAIWPRWRRSAQRYLSPPGPVSYHHAPLQPSWWTAGGCYTPHSPPDWNRPDSRARRSTWKRYAGPPACSPGPNPMDRDPASPHAPTAAAQFWGMRGNYTVRSHKSPSYSWRSDRAGISSPP